MHMSGIYIYIYIYVCVCVCVYRILTVLTTCFSAQAAIEAAKQERHEIEMVAKVDEFRSKAKEIIDVCWRGEQCHSHGMRVSFF